MARSAGLAPSYNILLVARVVGGFTGNSVPVAMLFIGLKVPATLRPRYGAPPTALLCVCCCVLLCGIVLYCAVLYCVVLCGNVLRCSELYCAPLLS